MTHIRKNASKNIFPTIGYLHHLALCRLAGNFTFKRIFWKYK